MRSVRLLGLLVCAIFLCGCVPLPNFRYYAPAVSGIVLQDGRPVSKAEVQVSGHFSNEFQVNATGQDGRFSTVPIRKLLLTASLIGDPLYAYSVQVTIGGKQFEGYSEAGVGYAPSKIELKCDIAHPYLLGGKRFYCSLLHGDA